MDIFEYAKNNNADYYDFHTGCIYHVQDYNRALKLGLPTDGILVTCDGMLVGIVRPDNH